MERKVVVKAIQKIISDIKEKCIIKNTAIRDSIFGILENECTVIYYPLENEKNRGFHIKKIVKNALEDFVYINTAKPIAEQIFAAAHEFGHIWEVAEKVWNILGYEGKPTEKEEEDITDWFAAELLMPTDEFRDAFYAHMNELGIKAGMVKLDEIVRVIVLQMNDFMVPYESVRRRLEETDIIPKETSDFLLSKQKEALELVAIFIKDSNTYLGKGTGVKTVSGIRTLIKNAESKENVDNYLLKKIKKEFDIVNMPITEEGFVRVAQYSDFLCDDEDKALYASYFIDIHNTLRKYLEAAGGKKQLERLILPAGQDVFTYRKAAMSLGDVHMILMAFFTRMPVILTEDSDIDILRSITKRKMGSETYALDIYNAVDLLIMIAEKEDSVFKKNDLVDIVKSIGERKHQSDIKQAWHRTHLGT